MVLTDLCDQSGLSSSSICQCLSFFSPHSVENKSTEVFSFDSQCEQQLFTHMGRQKTEGPVHQAASTPTDTAFTTPTHKAAIFLSMHSNLKMIVWVVFFSVGRVPGSITKLHIPEVRSKNTNCMEKQTQCNRTVSCFCRLN